jgi:hypothetical protein
MVVRKFALAWWICGGMFGSNAERNVVDKVSCLAGAAQAGWAHLHQLLQPDCLEREVQGAIVSCIVQGL